MGIKQKSVCASKDLQLVVLVDLQLLLCALRRVRYVELQPGTCVSIVNSSVHIPLI